MLWPAVTLYCSCVAQPNSLCISMLLQDIKKFNGMVEWTFNRIQMPSPCCDFVIWKSICDVHRHHHHRCHRRLVYFSLNWNSKPWQKVYVRESALFLYCFYLKKNGWKHKVPCKLPNFKQINTYRVRKMNGTFLVLPMVFHIIYVYYDFDVVFIFLLSTNDTQFINTTTAGSSSYFFIFD